MHTTIFPTNYAKDIVKQDLDKMSIVEKQKFYKKLQAIEAHIPNYLTDYEKVKIIHNAICRTCKYDYSFQEESYHIVSIFKHKAVCLGIAKWFNQIMKNLGIQCNIVCGEADYPGSKKYHAWNVVLINGQDLYIDVTWDMCSTVANQVSYKYFLISENEIRNDHFFDYKRYPSWRRK